MGQVNSQPAEQSPAPVVTSEVLPSPQEEAPAPDSDTARPRLGVGEQFRAFIASGWASHPKQNVQRTKVADLAAQRRTALSQAFPGQRLILPAGSAKVRSNDTDYLFRPHSAFAYYTGLGADREPEAVLVLEPREHSHEAVLYLRPQAGPDSDEFFASARYGQFWIGPRPSLEDLQAELGLLTGPLDHFHDSLAGAGEPGANTAIIREADPQLTAELDGMRGTEALQADAALAHYSSTQRMVKDVWEIEQLQQAVQATHRAFDAVITSLPEAMARGRGERWVEGIFGLHARHAGNGVGYDSICAAGDHANTLHWIRNTGELRPGELLLLDAGVELDSLYTADITRTLPLSGRFTPEQRQVYNVVYNASRAAMAAIKPGVSLLDVHQAAIAVIAQALHDWGMLPEGVCAQQSLQPGGGQYHRRWMVHGTSHHLGLDVHDCAHATREEYTDAPLQPGMVFTVEPGLYFKADDLLVPQQLRGIGVRIEDDIVVTQQGCQVLSDAIPAAPDQVEAWMARLLHAE